MTLSDFDQKRLAGVLTEAEFPELPGFQRGKVRESYDLGDGRRLMIATDRQSAFDHVLAAVPDKGHVLTATAAFWFEHTADICPNHVIDYPDPNVIIAKELNMLPVEMVVRDYITGTTDTSIWTMYAKGARTVYGQTLPDGLVKNDKLPGTIITPTTKGAVGGHDHPITAEDIVSQGLLTQAQWDEAAQKSLALFARGREIAAANGLILADTKYEFGLDENGIVTIADEIHTPDSSRYWRTETYADRHAAGEEPGPMRSVPRSATGNPGRDLDRIFKQICVAVRSDHRHGVSTRRSVGAGQRPYPGGTHPGTTGIFLICARALRQSKIGR